MSSFTLGTATFTQGSTSVTNVSLTSGRLSYFGRGTRVVVGSNPVVAEIEATQAPSNTEITLATAWPHASGTYAFLANMTSEGVREAVELMKAAAAQLQEAEAIVAALANIYEDTTEGLNNTINGDIFFVGSEGDTFLIQYLNDNGTAVERARLPSQALIEQGIAAAQTAQNAASAAGDSATLSQRFANEDEGVEVEPGLFSSRHFSAKSEGFSLSSEQFKDLANEFANAPEDTEVEPGLFSSFHWSAKSEGWADSSQGWSVVSENWAEGIEPGGVGTDSAKGWAEAAETFAGQAGDSETAAAQSVTLSEAWATGIQPGGVGTKSSREWSEEAEGFAQQTSQDVTTTGENVNLSKAWADGVEPGGAGTKSSKEWSEESKAFRDTTASYANYIGEWTAQGVTLDGGQTYTTGQVVPPAAVGYNGVLWQLLTTVAAIENEEPTTGNNNWFALTEAQTTDDLTEGTSNLYFTDERAVEAVEATDDWAGLAQSLSASYLARNAILYADYAANDYAIYEQFNGLTVKQLFNISTYTNPQTMSVVTPSGTETAPVNTPANEYSVADGWFLGLKMTGDVDHSYDVTDLLPDVGVVYFSGFPTNDCVCLMLSDGTLDNYISIGIDTGDVYVEYSVGGTAQRLTFDTGIAEGVTCVLRYDFVVGTIQATANGAAEQELTGLSALTFTDLDMGKNSNDLEKLNGHITKAVIATAD